MISQSFSDLLEEIKLLKNNKNLYSTEKQLLEALLALPEDTTNQQTIQAELESINVRLARAIIVNTNLSYGIIHVESLGLSHIPHNLCDFINQNKETLTKVTVDSDRLKSQLQSLMVDLPTLEVEVTVPRTYTPSSRNRRDLKSGKHILKPTNPDDKKNEGGCNIL